MAGTVDGKYYQVVAAHSLTERLVIRARDRIYADFLACTRPGPEDEILDVGVSDVAGEAPNVLERLYPRRERITAVGLGTAEAFQAEFPEVRYRQIAPGAPLPFADSHFAIATANAVLEHVGGIAAQAAFMAELHRVARRVFVSVPHRYFPVEHHTALPLAHYLDATFGPACRLIGKGEWARTENLILMSRRRLRAACPPGTRPRIGFTGLRLGVFSSNIFAYWEKT